MAMCGESPTIIVDGPQILVSVSVNGVRITIAKRNLEHFDGQDPYFFDSDYTIAGSTGFLLWEANWLLLRLLRGAATQPSPSPAATNTTAPAPLPSAATPATAAAAPECLASGHPPATATDVSGAPSVHLGRLLAGHRVLDLGSGTGLAGLCAAACGAHVLLTDLASVCAGALRKNVERNATNVAAPLAEVADADAAAAADAVASMRLQADAVGQASAREGAAGSEGQEAARPAGAEPASGVSGRPWAGAVPVGRGSAAVMALDWTEPLEPQVRAAGNDPRDADFILAVDTIWLKDIFHCFLDVVLAVLRNVPRPPSPQPQHADSADEHAIGGGSVANAGADCSPSGGSGGREPRACFLAFVERAGAESRLFVRKEAVVEELLARGCAVETLIAEDVDVDGVARPGRVLRVTLAGAV